MAMSVSAMLGLTTRFRVTVDGVDLGGWAKCSGLAVTFKNQRVKEGGNYESQPILAENLEYPDITLTRAMNAADSNRVQAWLRGKVDSWVNANSSGGGGTAEITLFDAKVQPVATWSLRNVYPAKWEGPELTVETFGIAVEKLTFVHEGFL
jgi:phage tail-like protein